MLVFGHTGITIGVAALLTNALSQNRESDGGVDRRIEADSDSAKITATQINAVSLKASWFAKLGNLLDIRLLLFGSLLPDIIDKPVGILLFGEALSNGRIFGHTLLFLLLVAMTGFYVYRRHGQTWLLAIGFGTFTHLVLDQMWQRPRTLFWPAYGFTFDRLDVSDWMSNIFYDLLHKPEVYIPEIVGLMILIWFTFTLVQKRHLFSFIRRGQVA